MKNITILALAVLSLGFAATAKAQDGGQICELPVYNNYWEYNRVLCRDYDICGLGITCPMFEFEFEPDTEEWPPMYPPPILSYGWETYYPD